MPCFAACRCYVVQQTDAYYDYMQVVLNYFEEGTDYFNLLILISKSRGWLIINYVNTEFNYDLYVFYHKDYG